MKSLEQWRSTCSTARSSRSCTCFRAKKKSGARSGERRRARQHTIIISSSSTSSSNNISEKKKKKNSVLEEALYSETKARGRENLFSNISPVYDVLNDALSLGLHRRWKRNVVRLTELKAGERALDVCCGSGDLAFILARTAGPRGHVSALDFSANMLSYALQRSVTKDVFQYTFQRQRDDDDNRREGGGRGGEGASTISWIHGDALALPFEDGSFDCVTIGYGLRNVEDREKCLREVYRVLRENKKAVILDFNSPKVVEEKSKGGGGSSSSSSGNRGSNNTRARIINNFRNLCLDTVVVPVATVCGLREEYAYLKPSIKEYPDGQSLVQLARESVGFQQAEFVEMAAGLMGALVLKK